MVATGWAGQLCKQLVLLFFTVAAEKEFSIENLFQVCGHGTEKPPQEVLTGKGELCPLDSALVLSFRS